MPRRQATRLRLSLSAGAVAAVVAAAAAFAGPALTASSSTGYEPAGQGAGAASGYSVGAARYELDGADPGKIDSISFTIAPAGATTVKVRLAAGSPWYDCTNAGGRVACDTTEPQATLAALGSLDVVAAA